MSLFETKDLGYRVADRQILSDINLTIQPGQHTRIAGPSGSGKSTLLKLLANLIAKSQGEIYFAGKAQGDYPPTDYRQQVSYCYQNPSLFGQKLIDNLAFPAQLRQDDFDEEICRNYMSALGLDHLDLDQSINDLSGGEKQRLALVRNLIYPPKALLLDEISSSLDAQTSQKVVDFLADYAKRHQTTLVLVSHNDYEAVLCQQEIYLDKGQVKEVKS
ncbi:ABC transporter [Aerococcus urinaehominis]|uniref:ABC transporter n=1 Tax=Aerococcus urinaehominis TaxID=128944 RepID=A0A0X8FM55_9LACT|nr:ATP-binding cassette domain-containing protein [Aerococcus urinaehominis]AMB99777.1 ABC transporter [Aerococcus urinaehominis]SDM09355.1 putative ABC transport system ATP-binding protein [Aerococcus urinaehominis]